MTLAANTRVSVRKKKATAINVLGNRDIREIRSIIKEEKTTQAASERCYVNIGVLRFCSLNNIFRNFWSKSLKNTSEEVHFLLSCRL